MPVVVAPPLEMSVEQRAALERMEKADSLPFRVVVQARALLMAADGIANGRIAREVGKKADTVRAWRKRFREEGVEGVGVVRPGRGRPPVIGEEIVERIVHDTLHARPGDGSTHLVYSDDGGSSWGGQGHRGSYMESSGTAALEDRDVQAVQRSPI